MPKNKKNVKHKSTGKLYIGYFLNFFLIFLAPFLVLESFLFNEFLRDGNYIEVFPKELIFPTAMHMVTGLIIALIITFAKRPKKLGPKVLSATFLGLLMVNYDDRLASVQELFRAVVPILPKPDNDIPIISLIFIMILIGLSLIVGSYIEKKQNKYKALTSKNILVATFIVVCSLFIGQAVKTVSILPSTINESSSTPKLLPKSNSPDITPAADKPDIYYIVLDRYTNNQVLSEQLNFDNSEFTNFLKQNNFTVNEGAYSNYPFTGMSISSTINADYTSDLVKPFKNNPVQARTLYHNLIRESSVVKALKDNGYEYYSIGSIYGATNKAPYAELDPMFTHELKIFNEKKRLRGLESLQFTKSPYYRLSKINQFNWFPLQLREKERVDYLREQLNILDLLPFEGEQGGRFIFTHMLIPHDPYILNADGSVSLDSGNDSQGRTIQDKYVGQVKFINSQIEDLVENIKKQSNGEAVIIINSDEGPYPHFLTETFENPVGGRFSDTEVIKNTPDMTKWSDNWLQMKLGIQQAVYIPKADKKDLDNLSSVNIFRIVLNKYFGYGLDYLPSCNFGITKSGTHEYNYANITERLTGKNAKECSQYESLPE